VFFAAEERRLRPDNFACLMFIPSTTLCNKDCVKKFFEHRFFNHENRHCDIVATALWSADSTNPGVAFEKRM